MSTNANFEDIAHENVGIKNLFLRKNKIIQRGNAGNWVEKYGPNEGVL